jgi:putative NADPH-quinone reductase
MHQFAERFRRAPQGAARRYPALTVTGLYKRDGETEAAALDSADALIHEIPGWWKASQGNVR